MDQIPWVYLLLIALVVAFGLGVLVLQRRGREDESAQPGEHAGAVAPPAARPVVVQEDEGAPEVDEVVAVGEVADDVGVAPVEPPAPRSMRERLARARSALSGAIGSVLGRSAIDDATWDELEEALLLADVGVGVATALLDPLRDRVTSGSIESPEQLIDALRDEMLGRLAGADRSLHRRSDEGPSVWLVVGVNGVGKTTTIGKLAARESAAGTTVLLAAGDTFRAAAAEQLSMWAERSGSEFVRGAEERTGRPARVSRHSRCFGNGGGFG